MPMRSSADMVGNKAVSEDILQKGVGHLGAYGAYDIISSLHGYCRYMTTAKGVQGFYQLRVDGYQ
jgi:hypothetical protein